MGVARKFYPLLEPTDSSGQPAARNVLTSLPVSTLNELVPASEETIDKIVARLRNGDKVTKVEAREIVREDRPAPKDATGDDVRPATATETPDQATYTDTPIRADPVDEEVGIQPAPIELQTLAMITMPLQERLEHTDDPLVIFGLNPFCDRVLINESTLEVLYNLLQEACKNDESKCGKITDAYERLRDESEMVAASIGLGLISHRIRTGYYEE